MSSDIEAQIREASAKNAELLRTLGQTDYAAPALEEQKRFIKDLEAEIRTSDIHLAELHRKRIDELADHEKYRDSNVKRFLHKIAGKRNEFDAKAAKEEREYFEALQAQHEGQTVNESLKYQLEEAKKTTAELENTLAVHRATQNELDGLYNSIFAGENPGFPNEDELEKKSDQTLQTYYDSSVEKEQADQYVNLLSKALAKAEEAQREMAEAHYRSRGDIMGRGALNDLKEHDALNNAAIAIQMARTLATRAQVQGLPTVNINTGGLMSDIFFDNIFTDMARNDEVKRGESEVARFKKHIAQALARATDRQTGAATTLTAAEKELEMARQELQDERQSVIEKVLKGQGVAAN